MGPSLRNRCFPEGLDVTPQECRHRLSPAAQENRVQTTKAVLLLPLGG